MNFTDINLDLQSTMRKIYADLLYRSNFMNMVNRDFLQVARTETPVIEVIKALPTSVRERNKVELTKANSLEADRLNPTLAPGNNFPRTNLPRPVPASASKLSRLLLCACLPANASTNPST